MKNGRVPVQIHFDAKEYEQLRKAAYKEVTTVNQYVKRCALDTVRRK